jgi:hypothetical protein
MVRLVAMLDRLSSIDWAQTRHVFGPGTALPDLLRALLDDELAAPWLLAEARESQCSLFRRTAHLLERNLLDGEAGSASVAVIPFLLELVEADLAPERSAFAITLLHRLAVIHPRERFPTAFDLSPLLDEAPAPPERDDELEDQLVAEGDPVEEEEPDPRASGGLPWALQCYLLVEAALPVFRQRLDEVDDRVVSSAIALLASFPTSAEASIDALRKLALDEDDSPLGGQALVALAQLKARDARTMAQVMCDAVGDQHAGSFFAAVADVLAAPTDGPARGKVSPGAIHRILAVPELWLALPCPFTGTLATLRYRALSRIWTLSKRELVELLSVVLPQASAAAKSEATQLLLRACSAAGPRLDALQRTALGLLVEHGAWSRSTRALLRDAGLPTRREDLRAFVT